MEWWLALLLIFGALVMLMAIGLPAAFCFMMVNVVGAYLLWGGESGLLQLIDSAIDSVSTFTLLALPLFMLLGEIMFQSGVIPLMLDALDKCFGRMPGRLGLLAVAGGTLFSTLTGVSMGTVAVLGSVLVPEMEKRGYKKPMSLGPVLGSGGLAIMIPPSGLAVLLGAIGELDVGQILIAIIIPGLLMAVLYTLYIVGRSWLQPHLAPPYNLPPVPLREKLVAVAKYILPLGFIIFMVTGVIFLGVASPGEAAATGAIAAFILAAAYGRLNWGVIKKAVGNTVEVTVMMLLIIVGAGAFGQILAFSGAIKGLSGFVTGLPLSPILILIAIQVVVLIMGMFMHVIAIMMITIPVFLPVITAMGFSPIWFAVIFLLNVEMAGSTPPFGLMLFVMKGVAPPDTTMADIYKAALPFLYCDAIAMALIIAFPTIAMWLPGQML